MQRLVVAYERVCVFLYAHELMCSVFVRVYSWRAHIGVRVFVRTLILRYELWYAHDRASREGPQRSR